MSKRRTKNAKVPKEVWDDRKRVAKQWGFGTASMGFTIKDKLLYGDYKVKRVKKKKNGTTVFWVEFDKL